MSAFSYKKLVNGLKDVFYRETYMFCLCDVVLLLLPKWRINRISQVSFALEWDLLKSIHHRCKLLHSSSRDFRLVQRRKGMEEFRHICNYYSGLSQG